MNENAHRRQLEPLTDIHSPDYDPVRSERLFARWARAAISIEPV